MNINGVELDFAFYAARNVDMRERYLNELKDITEHIDKELADIPDKVGRIKHNCARIRRLFDVTFGEGTGAKVCGTDDDELVCIEAYETLLRDQIAQSDRYNSANESMVNIGNRAARRARARNNKKGRK